MILFQIATCATSCVTIRKRLVKPFVTLKKEQIAMGKSIISTDKISVALLEQGMILDAKQTATLLGISIHTLRKWAEKGKIPHFKYCNRTLRFDRNQLAQWIVKQQGRWMHD